MEKSIEEQIVLALLEVANQLNRNGGVITGRVGLTTQQWLILLYLAGDPNIPQTSSTESKPKDGLLASEIADALNVSRANITNLINALLNKGLVKQQEDSGDRRRKRLALTQKARDLVEQIEPFRKRANQSLLSQLKEDERIFFLKTLNHLAERLNRK